MVFCGIPFTLSNLKHRKRHFSEYEGLFYEYAGLFLEYSGLFHEMYTSFQHMCVFSTNM